MKSFFSFFLSICVVSITFAQVPEIPLDTLIIKSSDKYTVETNRFFDNWFIGAGTGTQFFIGDHNMQMKITDRLTPAYEFYVGKWFTPGIGLRTGLNGLKISGVTQNGSHSTGKVYESAQRLKEQEFSYIHVHGDVLFNLTHMLNGYHENPIFTISPYLGLGWMFTWDNPVAREISANIGVYNSLRISEAVDLTFDLRGSLVNDRFDGEVGGRKEEGMFTAAIGLAYKFGKRTWDAPKTIVIRYSEEELNVLRRKVNKLAASNEALREELATAKNKTITDIKTHQNVLVSPILVTFPINQSVVSNEARVNLGFFAKAIKENNSDLIYKITGYADKGTGSPRTNERLSRERATAIYNVLVKEFGVPASRLKVEYKGGVDNMFYDDPRLNRAVIAIAE